MDTYRKTERPCRCCGAETAGQWPLWVTHRDGAIDVLCLSCCGWAGMERAKILARPISNPTRLWYSEAQKDHEDRVRVCRAIDEVIESMGSPRGRVG